MKKWILAIIVLIPSSNAMGLEVGDLEVLGRIISERMDVSTHGKVAVIGFIDGSSQTLAFSPYSTYTWTAAQSFSSSTTFSSSTINIGGIRYFFQTTVPVTGDQILHRLASSSSTYWGGDNAGVASGGGDSLGTHIATQTLSVPNFAVSGSSITETGRVVAEGSATIRGIIISTAGFQVGASTVQGAFMVEGGTFQFRNGTNEFSINFASGGYSVGQHLMVSQIVANRFTIASGGDDAGTGGGGGGGSTLAVATGSAQAAVVITSPTAIITFSSGTHKIKLTGGSTAYIELDFSTVTAQGDVLVVLRSTGVALSNLDTSFRNFTSTSDAQQIKFVNFRSTSDTDDNFLKVRNATSDTQIANKLEIGLGVIFATNTRRSLANGIVENNQNVITSTMVQTLGINAILISSGELQAGTTSNVSVSSSNLATVIGTFTVVNGTMCIGGTCFNFSSAPAAVGNHWIITALTNGVYQVSFGGDNTGAAATAGADNLGSHVTTKTIVNTGFAITGSSIVEGGRLIFEGSGTVRGVIISSTGFQIGASTVQGVFMVEGGTFQFRNGANEFSITFASGGYSVGEHLIVSQVTGNRFILASGGDNAGTVGSAGAGGGFVYDGSVTTSFSTISINTPFGLATINSANTASTFTVLGTTNPYRTISIPAASWLGFGNSSASWLNSGFSMIETTSAWNVMGEVYHQFKNPNSTASFVMTSFRMPFEWDGSSISAQVSWYASTGQANTNCAWSFGGIATSSGTNAFQAYTSSVTIFSTWISSGTEIQSPQTAGFNIQGSPVPGSRVKFFLSAGGGAFTGLPKMTEVVIFFRQKFYDGNFR